MIVTFRNTIYSQKKWVRAKLYCSDKVIPDHNSNLQEDEKNRNMKLRDTCFLEEKLRKT